LATRCLYRVIQQRHYPNDEDYFHVRINRDDDPGNFGEGWTLDVHLRRVDVSHASELDHAFAVITRARADALIVLPDPLVFGLRQRSVEWAARSRLPVIYFTREFVEAGGLMTYGPDLASRHRHAATYVDKILKGAKPADLPVEQPTTFELVINLKTAQALGLTIPPTLLFQADEVLR
jgi:putative ABC transport system substrate-binding protein